MDVPNLRHVDFDAYRQRAADLRAETIDLGISRAWAWLRSLLKPRPLSTAGRRPAATSQCAA